MIDFCVRRCRYAFTGFCDAIGMSSSSLMNMFAKTVVRNQKEKSLRKQAFKLWLPDWSFMRQD